MLLFDWDNTLVDAWDGVAAALNAALVGFEHPAWTVAETRARVRGSLRDTFPDLFGADWHRARELFYGALAKVHLRHLQPMPGAAALLAMVTEAGWPVGVVSNKTGAFLRAEVGQLGWAAYFGAMVGAGDAAADKPAADPILLALRLMEQTADGRVWYCGDTAIDMQAARAAGVQAVLIGDAGPDGGPGAVGPSRHFGDCAALARHMRALA